MLTAKKSPFQFWDGRAGSLEEQALGPIANALEMDADLQALEGELQAIPMYDRLFKSAYGGKVSKEGIARAIAAFERALDAKETPYERWQLGDDSALSPAARRGQDIFSRNMCGDCHKGLDFTDNDFHNTGWGLDLPNPDVGRFKVTGDEKDDGAFKTPTLRNIVQSAPYFHDGRAGTLEEVVDFYRKGGLPNPHLDEKIQPMTISDQDAADLVTFLKEGFACDTNLKELAQSTVGAEALSF
jgi:cytochrome c peroxidase